MRIKIIIECPKLPLIHRNRIQAFLKQALLKSSENFLQQMYKDSKPRGFTFNAYFGKKEDYFITENWLLINPDNMIKSQCFNFKNNHFSLYVSSNDDNFMINLITGLRKMGTFYFSNPENKTFTIDHEIITFKVKKILPQDEKIITNKEIIFKTNSPFLFENKLDIPILFNDERFKEQVNHTMSRIMEKPCDIEITVIEAKKKVIKHAISAFLGTNKPVMFLTGSEGVFKMKSDLETLKYIYQCGFGVRTSQGFGMMDILQD